MLGERIVYAVSRGPCLVVWTAIIRKYLPVNLAVVIRSPGLSVSIMLIAA
jgi:hypothetical protein